MRFDPRGARRRARGARRSSSAPTALGDDGRRCSAPAASPPRRGSSTRTSRPRRRCGCAANPWSTGDGLEHALDRGAALSAGHRRVLRPQHARRGVGRGEFVAAVAAVRALRAHLRRGRRRVLPAGDVSWSETNVVQATARRPGARAYYLLDERGARRARARADGRRDGRARAAEARVAARRAAVPPPAGTVAAVRVAPRSRTRSAGCAIDERRACSTDGRRSTGSGPRASTPAASRPAATRAGSRRRSCSASPPPRTPRAEPAQTLSACRRRSAGAASPGQRRRAELGDDERAAVVLELVADGGSSPSLLAQRVAGRRPDEEQVVGVTVRQTYAGVAYGGSVTTTRVPPSPASTTRSCRAAAARAPRSPRTTAGAAPARRRPRRTSRRRRRRRVAIAHRDLRRRAAADRLLEQLADDRVERDLRRLAEPVRRPSTSRSIRIACASRPARRAPRAPAPKPWSRSTTGSSAKERSRSSRIVARWRSSAVASTLVGVVELAGLDRVRRPRRASARCRTRFCTGPSWRKSAIRRRSSCSAAISRSSAPRPPRALSR